MNERHAKAYPVPVRKPWRVLLEFNDGQHLTGMDDTAVIDAWRRMHWLTPLPDFDDDRAQFKTMLVAHARALYNEPLFGIGGETDDETFLDALSTAGAITVVRK